MEETQRLTILINSDHVVCYMFLLMTTKDYDDDCDDDGDGDCEMVDCYTVNCDI